MWFLLFLCRVGMQQIAEAHLGAGYTCLSLERMASVDTLNAGAYSLKNIGVYFLFALVLFLFLGLSYLFSDRIHKNKKNT